MCGSGIRNEERGKLFNFEWTERIVNAKIIESFFFLPVVVMRRKIFLKLCFDSWRDKTLDVILTKTADDMVQRSRFNVSGQRWRCVSCAFRYVPGNGS